MAGLRVACVVAVMCMVVALSARAAPSSSISCSTVSNYLSPCYSYLRNGGKPSSSCCNGVKNIYNEDKNTADVRATCKCLKSLASTTTVSANYAASLPAKCDIKIPYKISNFTDCTVITI